MPSVTPVVKRELNGTKLVWNVLFWGGHIAIFAYGWYKQASDARLAGLNTLKFSVWASRGAGLCLGVDGLLLILPGFLLRKVLRNVLRYLRPVPIIGSRLDDNIWFHRQVAYSLLMFTIVHTTAHYVNMFNVEITQIRKETAWAIMYTQPGGFTGHVMLVLMLLMYTSAHKKIREQCFEAFWYTHHLSFIFLLGLYTHATGCFVRGALPGQQVRCLGYNSWNWTIWAGIAYFFERMIRVIRARQSTKLVGVLMHPSGAMELRFIKPSFSYRPGQWLYINVPEISQWQWHPFTISSAPDDPYISCHIRQVGDFTTALGDRLGCSRSLAKQISKTSGMIDEKRGFSEDDSDDFVEVGTSMIAAGQLPTICIDGPFGAPAEHVFSNEVAVLIGTGIGVTPFASILKHIWYKQQRQELGALRRVRFIWVNRETGSFEWFQSLLKNLEEAQTDTGFLSINTFLTGRINEDDIHNITIHDVDSDQDALTQLRTRTQFGRPDWSRIFESIREEMEGNGWSTGLPGRESTLSTTVGVYYCGPPALAKVLKAETKTVNETSKKKGGSVRFTFKKEHF